MRTHRFGSKIKLPSTVAIKHQLLTVMLEDEIKAIPAGGTFNQNDSPALGMLRRLAPNGAKQSDPLNIRLAVTRNYSCRPLGSPGAGAL